MAQDTLFLLDLRLGEEKATWIVVPINGTPPGKRYGHSLNFYRPNLMVFGGNTGNEPVNDVWILNVEKAPFVWVNLAVQGEIPESRVYHSAAVCQKGNANGMMIIFGGRNGAQVPINDVWGFRKHKVNTIILR